MCDVRCCGKFPPRKRDSLLIWQGSDDRRLLAARARAIRAARAEGSPVLLLRRDGAGLWGSAAALPAHEPDDERGRYAEHDRPRDQGAKCDERAAEEADQRVPATLDPAKETTRFEVCRGFGGERYGEGGHRYLVAEIFTFRP